jgi:hypothetical protein
MPIDERAEPALKLAPILDDLSLYELKVTGLSGAQYELSIDGEAVGKASGADLAKGWNLAAAPGPVTRQASEVLSLVFQKNNLYFNRWRGVQLFEFPAWARSPETDAMRAAELARLDREISEVQARIETARKPKSHRFAIKPVAE